MNVSRRVFLARSVSGAIGLGLFGAAIVLPTSAQAGGADDFGSLLPPDGNGLRLPPGFRSRILARSGQTVALTGSHSGSAAGRIWHADPDGGATFASADGGWVYVSNAEAVTPGGGGVGVIRFDASANVVDAYRILSGTTRNCAGGKTPWQTWLSCEETPTGRVWECNPFAPGSEGTARPALGVFQHEAAAVDPVHRNIYLTEDRTDGLLYRFTPTAYPSLAEGVLEVAQILDPNGQGSIVPGQSRPLAWHAVPDPLATHTETRLQVALASRFTGCEGIDYHPQEHPTAPGGEHAGQAGGQIYFSTKGDDRVWQIDTATDQISIRYDRATMPGSPLSGVDNVFVTPNGDIYVAEDPGDLQIVALTVAGQIKPIVQVIGQLGSEITGPALSPDGRRLYFSSQRSPGTTYEVEGPFLGPTASALGSLSGLTLAGALGAMAARHLMA